MTDEDADQTPVGGRRGYPRTMTIIMVAVTVVIIIVAIVQWVRV